MFSTTLSRSSSSRPGSLASTKPAAANATINSGNSDNTVK